MKRYGLISDTHQPQNGPMPVEIIQAFAGVDGIIHAGDVYDSPTLDWLERIAPVIAVEMDPALCIGDPRVEVRRRTFELDGHRIGLTHDLAFKHVDELVPGVIERRFPDGESIAEAVSTAFWGERLSVVVFGHSHVVVNEEHDGVLFVNPGSPTLPRQIRRLGNVAILELDGPRKSARILDLKDYRTE